jgi:hypothetical protein
MINIKNLTITFEEKEFINDNSMFGFGSFGNNLEKIVFVSSK